MTMTCPTDAERIEALERQVADLIGLVRTSHENTERAIAQTDRAIQQTAETIALAQRAVATAQSFAASQPAEKG